jgi:hypothetical protein
MTLTYVYLLKKYSFQIPERVIYRSKYDVNPEWEKNTQYTRHSRPGVAYWLRHCATSRRVSGSIPNGVAGDFSEATDGIKCPEVESASKNEYQENSWG